MQNPTLNFRPYLFSAQLEDLIRSELFSPERMDEHARSLAHNQPVTDDPSRGIQIFPRLRKNGKILRDTYTYISAALAEDEAITPAAEWLVDSFYVIDEQLRDIRRGLPKEFYDELPKLTDGFLKGYPRIYGICWAYVAHTDSRFDPQLLIRFVRAYQEVQPLTIGELWAFSVTLRIVMIENLRRIAVRIVASQEARNSANAIADEFLGMVSEVPKKKLFSLDDFDKLSDGRSFLVQLVQRLRYHDPKSTPALAWLNTRLSQENTTADELASMTHQTIAATNATVRNIITSFRLMTSYSWPDFFEEASLVHGVLAARPGFEEMDFNTRDLYRHAVEDIARASRKTELEIANAAIALADARPEFCAGDVGYYLIGKGRADFERQCGVRYRLRSLWHRWYLANARFTYFASLTLAAILVLAIPFLFAVNEYGPILILLGFLGFFPAAEIGQALVNRFITTRFGPKRLPRLELLDGPSADSRTIVVVPTLLVSESEVASQFEKLEVHYLSNPEGDTCYALLTDWADSTVEYDEARDGPVLAVARRSVETLNERHGLCSDGTARFYLFHRRRLWNAVDGVWMGWERKRGKLHEFNQLLRGDQHTSYFVARNEQDQAPKNIRCGIL